MTFRGQIMDKEEKKISSEEIYHGKILNLVVDKVLLPNGHISTREVVRHCKASAILAIDDNDNIILEDQFRYPYNEIIKEVPAGKCDEGEAPIDTARRELEEETGYQAKNLIELGVYYPSVAYTDEIIYLFLAKDLVKVKQHLDEDEVLDYYKVPISTAIEMVKNGQIKDGKTIAILCQYLIKYKNK